MNDNNTTDNGSTENEVTEHTGETVETPEGWTKKKEELSGNFKLIAQYVRGTETVEVAEGVERPGVEVKVSPWKSYDQPGFCDCHSIKLVDRSGEETETVVKGRTPSSTEYVEDAQRIAEELMHSYEEAREYEEPELESKKASREIARIIRENYDENGSYVGGAE